MNGRLGFQGFWEYFFCSEANASVESKEIKGRRSISCKTSYTFRTTKEGTEKTHRCVNVEIRTEAVQF